MPSSIKIVPLILDLPFTILWILSFIIASYYSTSKNHLHLTDNRNRPANNVSRLHTLGVLLAWQVVVLTGVVWVKVLALVLRHVVRFRINTPSYGI